MSIGFASALRADRFPGVTDGPIRGAGSGGGGADPGLTLLQSATLWLDASDMASGAQWLRNKGTGGRALDARVGSVGSAQIINGALKLPGTSGNTATAPDSTPLDIVDDIDIQVRLSLVDWTPAAAANVLSKATGSAGTWGYGLAVAATTGVVQLYWGESSTGRVAASTVAPTVTDGSALWIRATREKSSGNVKFYTSPDGASPTWTQLGTTVASGFTASMNNVSSGLIVGGFGGSTPDVIGSVFRVIIRNGYDGAGSVAFDADFTAQSTLATSFTESSSNAATVTINSTSGVDTNDPLLLTHTGTNYLYLPGLASNWATTPDLAASRPSGTTDVIGQLQLPDWTPSSAAYVINQGGYTSNQRLRFYVNTDGKLGVLIYTEAGVSFTAASTVATGFTDGDMRWVRVLVEPGSPDGTCKFYTSTDGSSWTQLGTTVTATGITDLRTSVGGATTGIGSITSTVGLTVGNFYRVQVWSGDSTSGGTKQFDADFTANTNQSSFTESSSNAATVTINRATSGRKAVMVVRPTLLFGTDDYLEVADNALLDFAAADSFTVMAVTRQHGTKASGEKIISKRQAGATLGYDFYATTTRTSALRISHGGPVNSTDTSETSVTDGSRALLSGVRDTAADTLTARNGSEAGTPTTDSTTLSIENGVVFRVGTEADGLVIPFAGEIDTVAVFRTALTSTELGQIATYLGV